MLRILRFLGKLYLFLFYKVRFYGIENIPDKGGYLLCSNHISNLDVILIGVHCRRRVHWMAKQELFRIPVLSLLLRGLGAYPVARGRGDRQAIDKSLDLLKQEKIVGVFPQGTRVGIAGGKKVPAKYGAGMFALESGKPVLPVAIEGNSRLFSRITVTFGTPCVVKRDPDLPTGKEAYQRISQDILNTIYLLLEGRVYGNHSG